MSLRIRPLTPAELGWANTRYAEVDFLPSRETDLVAVASMGEAPAGLGRVVPLAPGVGELGGMYVFPEYRGAGVSRALIDFLVGSCGLGTLYCLPFRHLEGLYRAAGFEACAPDASVPAEVVGKHAWCNLHYPEPVLLLRREA